MHEPTQRVQSSHAKDFMASYTAELDARSQRSEIVGVATQKKGNAALFFDRIDGKFTLLEKLPDTEEAVIFDCIPREQWGRTVMLFGHTTVTGRYNPAGHGTLTGNVLRIRLANGRCYRLTVEADLPHLQPFFVEAPKNEESRRVDQSQERGQSMPRQQSPKPLAANASTSQRSSSSASEAPSPQTERESEDLTAEDLRRLRGEIPLTAKKRRY